MTEEEEWVNNAMSDDTLVVDILLRLNRADLPPPPPAPMTTKTASSPPLQLEWSVRQRRSKQGSRKKGEPTRASPTTPLSWSGATTSASGLSTGAADGFEESSKPPRPVDNPRSKAIGTSETTTTTRKSRKKKTLAELKEEEDLLLKERKNLNQQLASLRVNIAQQKATNESLKKMKLDVVSHQTTETVRASPATQEAITNQHHQMEVDCDPSRVVMPAIGSSNELNPSVSNTSSKVQEDGSKTSSFVLPDLNLPVEDDPVSRDLYGIS